MWKVICMNINSVPEVQFSQAGEEDSIKVDRQKVLKILDILSGEWVHCIVTSWGVEDSAVSLFLTLSHTHKQKTKNSIKVRS